MSDTRSQLPKGVLWSLRADVAAVDRNGQVTFIRRAPAVVTRTDECRPIVPDRTGVNYLEFLAATAGGAEGQLLDGIHAVLDGRSRGVWIHYGRPAREPRHWYAVRIAPMRARGGGAVISHIDVTESRRADAAGVETAGKAASRGHERYHRIFEAAGVAIWELDYTPVARLARRLQRLGVADIRDTVRGRRRLIERLFRAVNVRDMNEEALRLTGVPDKQAARSRVPGAFLTLEDGFVEAIAAVAEGRREVRTNDIIRTFRGDERRVAVTLRIPADVASGGSVLYCAHDVTELDYARRRYELATVAGGVSVFEYHVSDDVLLIDSELKATVGLSDGLVTGADLRARIHPADVGPMVALYDDALRDDAPVDQDGNTPVAEIEFRLIGSDGGDHWFLKRGTVMRDARGRADRIIGTMTDITDRKVMEEAVRVSQDRLRDLAGRLIAAQEDERLRIARDLEDDLNQRLGTIANTLRLLRCDVTEQPASIRTEIRRLELEIDQLRNEVSGLSDAMHSAFPEGAGLVQAFRTLCREFGRIEGLDVDLEIGSGFASIPRFIGLCLYRVAQEALRNSARHSGSRVANIKLHMDNGRVVMDVRDSGCGFDQPVQNGWSGLGLVSMRERVRLAGGEMSIRSSPGMGTDVYVSIPLSRD